MIRRPPRSTLFPTRRSSDLLLEKAFAIEPKNFQTAYDIGEAYRMQSFTGDSDYATEAQAAMDWYAQAKRDRKSTRLNSSHSQISYAVFCLKKKKKANQQRAH